MSTGTKTECRQESCTKNGLFSYINCKGGKCAVRKEEITGLFALNIRRVLQRAVQDFAQVYEIRLRAHMPVILVVVSSNL